MRILCLIASVVFFLGCNTSKKNTTTAKEEVVTATDDATKLTGKVTYLVNGNSCLSVLILDANQDTENKLILIPRAALADNMAKEGILISFNYRPLKMKNPEGCLKGIPAELSNVVLKTK